MEGRVEDQPEDVIQRTTTEDPRGKNRPKRPRWSRLEKDLSRSAAAEETSSRDENPEPARTSKTSPRAIDAKLLTDDDDKT